MYNKYCKCGNTLMFDYNGGSPGVCIDCWKIEKQNYQRKKNEIIVQNARKQAEMLGISLTDALNLYNNKK